MSNEKNSFQNMIGINKSNVNVAKSILKPI